MIRSKRLAGAFCASGMRRTSTRMLRRSADNLDDLVAGAAPRKVRAVNRGKKRPVSGFAGKEDSPLNRRSQHVAIVWRCPEFVETVRPQRPRVGLPPGLQDR